MKTKLVLFLALLSILCVRPAIAQPCSNSSLTLNSVNAIGGGLFELDVRLCVGGGILGANRGAGGPTGTFAFSFASTGLTVSSFPATVVSDTTGCLFSGFDQGAQAVLNADVAIIYLAPGGTCDYACISSTALCGFPHSDCEDYVFTVNQIPDSIRAYGIEGNGNPFGGCLNLSSMAIDFTTALEVVWGEVESQWHPNGLTLTWETFREENNAFFVVERSLDLQSWQDRGSVPTLGESSTPQSYTFRDEALRQTTYYRIKQIDQNGQFSYSSRIAVQAHPSLAALSIFPNPTEGELFVRGLPAGRLQLSLFNQVGQEVLTQRTVDQDQLQLQTAHLPQGVYLMRLQHADFRWQERIVIR